MSTRTCGGIGGRGETFYFAEEGPGCGSEDIKKECNVNFFDFFFFSVFLMDVIGEKITINLKQRH